jgi:methylenetetrahydrofolate--tRNA-(uracil-5-)-methyltransferase
MGGVCAPRVSVVGAGLAGCEAACQIARRGIGVLLFERKPLWISPAHRSRDFAELVCSNSLRAASLANASGLLEQEMRRLGSLVMAAADECAVPAGVALAELAAWAGRVAPEAPAGGPACGG